MTDSVQVVREPTLSEELRAFAGDVRRDLALMPKRLQAKYLYDELGSLLFEAICRLPWYRITRAECGLLEEHACEILTDLGETFTIVELGGGSGEKLGVLAEAIGDGRPIDAHLIDVSPAALEASARTLSRFDNMTLVQHRATYEDGLRSVVRVRACGQPVLVLLLGSNIGNFDHEGGAELLYRIASTLRSGDRLLLGADLVKPQSEIHLAYDDPIGVTSAFNKNLLARINRELGGDFDLTAFDHQAIWNEVESRVEMHLISRRPQRVAIPLANCRIEFEPGESIWTESSYKYEPHHLLAMGAEAGFVPRQQWIDEDARFALTLFEAP